MIASALSGFAQLNQWLLHPVHPTFFPFPLITCIHAARVSMAYTSNVQRVSKLELQSYQSQRENSNKPYRTWLMDLVGFLVMAWGGSFVSNYLVHSTPPQLLTIYPLIQYLSIHIFLKTLFKFTPSPSASTLDSTLWLLDGATRTGALIGGLTLASKHFPSPLSPKQLGNDSLTSSSFILPLILGTISTSFGGQSAGTFNVFSSNWSFGTLPILKARDLKSSVDVWSPLLASFSHGLFNSYHPLFIKLRIVFGLSRDGEIVLGTLGSKALVSMIITMAFAWRAVELHWLNDQKLEVKRVNEKVKVKIGNGNAKASVNGKGK